MYRFNRTTCSLLVSAMILVVATPTWARQVSTGPQLTSASAERSLLQLKGGIIKDCSLPGYTFYPNVNHTGDDVIGSHCVVETDPISAVVDFNNVDQADSTGHSAYAGFSYSGIIDGKSWACPKTSAVGTPANPHYTASTNPPADGTQCGGLYIKNVCVIPDGYLFFRMRAFIGFDLEGPLGCINADSAVEAAASFKARNQMGAGFTFLTEHEVLKACPKSYLGQYDAPYTNLPQSNSEVLHPCSGVYTVIPPAPADPSSVAKADPVTTPVVCTAPDGFVFIAGKDHPYDDAGVDVCIRAVSAAAAVAAFKTSSTVYSGFTLSTIDGIQQACPKTYRVENAPVSNTPTDPSQFADPCQGLYILKPNVTVPVVTLKKLGCVQDYVVPTNQTTSDNKWAAKEWADIRALPHITVMDAGSASLTTCAAIAKKLNYTYFGVEHGLDCWSGPLPVNTTLFPFAKNDTDCNLACTGDSTQNCGGSNSLLRLAQIVTA